MNIKELKEKIKDLPDDTKVVCIGEYDLGVKIDSASVEKLIYAGEEIIEEERECFALSVSSYLADCTDIGFEEMYLPASEWENTKEEEGEGEGEND